MCRRRNEAHDFLEVAKKYSITHSKNQQNLIYETKYVLLNKEYSSIPRELPFPSIVCSLFSFCPLIWTWSSMYTFHQCTETPSI